VTGRELTGARFSAKVSAVFGVIHTLEAEAAGNSGANSPVRRLNPLRRPFNV
jgi:hypothetical protein